MSSPILIFGAAGGIGHFAALASAKQGAKVYLAMRDTKKPIPGLTTAEEENLGFTRVQADLLDPSSIKTAVTTSGATTAFVYTLFTAPDHMASTFAALKDAGITTLVLLSSYGVRPSAEAAQHDTFIPAVHAKTELALIASRLNYVAVRPAFFNTNLTWYKAGVQAGEVPLYGTAARFDFIAPEDIGAVIATMLTQPAQRESLNDEEGGKSVYLCGPRLMTRVEALGIVGKVLGKDIKVPETSEEAYWEESKHHPRPVAESVLELMKGNIPPETEYEEGFWKAAVENVRKYAGREPTSFEQWAEAHKGDFE
jgi:uncharacterized protein YbjT (DUF2867 family)